MFEDFDPPDDGNPSPDESLNFFAEMERMATDENFVPFTVILMSGDHLKVEAFGQLAVYQTMYIYHGASEEVMFPFPNVCAVRSPNTPS